MNKGIYIALSGAVLKRSNVDIIAQNIANAHTHGYKKERISFKDHIVSADNNPGDVQESRVMVELGQKKIDFSHGTFTPTGSPLDVAIQGDGFFALDGGRYTRNGSFRMDKEGYLVTATGVRVLGEGGPIVVQGKQVDITASGDVVVDDIPFGKLKIVDFPDRTVLNKIDGSMFSSDAEGEASSARVSQGFLEESNVNIIQEMITMLASQREFESYQKMIHAFDEAASKTINEMGK